MDYKKLYKDFINYCKKTTPYERLQKRNSNDFRLKNNEKLYIEIHHIIPKFDGGTDKEENLVELLPEEHIFVHQLRYKAYNKRGDMLAVRFILNGLKGVKNEDIERAKKSNILNKKILQGYAWIKQHSYNFRKKVGWHTKEGLKKISKSSKGKIIVKDVKTGELIGKVDVNHPKVLSGEWVHHTKGWTTVIEKETGKKLRIKAEDYQKNKDKYIYLNTLKGEKNGRYSGITREDIINYFLKYIEYIESIEDKCLMSQNHFKNYVQKEFNKKIPHSYLSEFRFPEYKNSNYKNLYFLVDLLIDDEKEKEKYFSFLRGKSKKQIEKMLETVKSKKEIK